MSRIAYVNGRYVAFRDARIHIEDRGFQFADGVYEVILLVNGRQIDGARHLDRLDRSLRELGIKPPVSRKALGFIADETARRNGVTDGLGYIQVTRGTAPRDHAVPARARPTLVVTARSRRVPDRRRQQRGIAVATTPDLRWGRCDIKTVALVANVLAKDAAQQQGAYEAWLVDKRGRISEGTSTNAWIVARDGTLITHPADAGILCGITRLAVIDLARAAGFKIKERAFTLKEAKAAREAFVTSATSFVLPVVQLDGRAVGRGVPGPTTRALQAAYVEHVRSQAHPQ
jgi:D-alanine transaminase